MQIKGTILENKTKQKKNRVMILKKKIALNTTDIISSSQQRYIRNQKLSLNSFK